MIRFNLSYGFSVLVLLKCSVTSNTVLPIVFLIRRGSSVTMPYCVSCIPSFLFKKYTVSGMRKQILFCMAVQCKLRPVAFRKIRLSARFCLFILYIALTVFTVDICLPDHFLPLMQPVFHLFDPLRNTPAPAPQFLCRLLKLLYGFNAVFPQECRAVRKICRVTAFSIPERPVHGRIKQICK